MPHLNPEELARLADETPTAAEASHLGACGACTEAVAELRRQTAALAALPPIDPPRGEWKRLEDAMRQEGLVRAPSARIAPRAIPGTWAAAAAVAAFIVGGVGGFAVRGPGQTPESGALPRIQTELPADLATPVSLEDAEGQVRVAERQYLNALDRYNEMRGPELGEDGEPWAARWAALESIVASTRAALQEAPYDPVINGYYLNASAQRDAMFQQVSTGDGDQWH